MSFPAQTLATINDAFVSGMNGIAMPFGNKLRADYKPDDIDKVADDQLPFLLIDIGAMTFQPWKGWERQISWDVVATLKVKGDPQTIDRAVLRCVDALLLRTIEITGLPVDENGKTVAYSEKTATLFDQDKLQFLAERGAPYITRVQVQPSQGAYAKAQVGFHIEAVLNLDPRTLPVARKAVLGIDPVPPGQIFQDSTLPDYVGIAVIPPSADLAWGAYNQPDPIANRQGGALKQAAGVTPQQFVQSVNVTPYSAALSAIVSTKQLQAVAIHGNYSSEYVTAQGTWTTSDATVATVSAGLVTRVAAGSCTITCTYEGVTSNAVAITCS